MSPPQRTQKPHGLRRGKIAERMAQRAKRKHTIYRLFLQRYALCAMPYAIGQRRTQISGIRLRRTGWKLIKEA
jgi:hypothetical protein